MYNEQMILGVRSDVEARYLMEGNPFDGHSGCNYGEYRYNFPPLPVCCRWLLTKLKSVK
jgi:hypothetical protein